MSASNKTSETEWKTKRKKTLPVVHKSKIHISSRLQCCKFSISFFLHSMWIANLLHAFHGQLIGTHFRMFSLTQSSKIRQKKKKKSLLSNIIECESRLRNDTLRAWCFVGLNICTLWSGLKCVADLVDGAFVMYVHGFEFWVEDTHFWKLFSNTNFTELLIKFPMRFFTMKQILIFITPFNWKMAHFQDQMFGFNWEKGFLVMSKSKWRTAYVFTSLRTNDWCKSCFAYIWWK